MFGEQEKATRREESEQHQGERLAPPSWFICMTHLSFGPSVVIEARHRPQKSFGTPSAAASEEGVRGVR